MPCCHSATSDGEVMRAVIGLLPLIVLSSGLLSGQTQNAGQGPLAFTRVTVIGGSLRRQSR